MQGASYIVPYSLNSKITIFKTKKTPKVLNYRKTTKTDNFNTFSIYCVSLGEDSASLGEDLEVQGEDLEVQGEDLEVQGEDLEVQGEDLEAKSDDREAHGADIKSFSKQFLCLNIENTFFFLVPKVLFGNGNDWLQKRTFVTRVKKC